MTAAIDMLHLPYDCSGNSIKTVRLLDETFDGFIDPKECILRIFLNRSGYAISRFLRRFGKLADLLSDNRPPCPVPPPGPLQCLRSAIIN